MNVSVPAALWSGSSGQTLLQKTIRKRQHGARRTILMDRRFVSRSHTTDVFCQISAQTHPGRNRRRWCLSCFKTPNRCCVASDISLKALPQYLGKVFIFHEATQEATLPGAAPTAVVFFPPTGLKRADTKQRSLRVSFNTLKRHYKHIQIIGQQRSHLPFQYKIDCNLLQK